MGIDGTDGLSLSDNLLSLLLGLDLEGVVLLNSLDEGLSGSGLSDVLNSNMNSLGDDSSIVTLVHNNTDGVGSHIEDSAGFSVVVLVGHTLMNGSISNHINVVSDLVDGEVLGEGGSSVLLEIFGEKISGSCSNTMRVYHFFIPTLI